MFRSAAVLIITASAAAVGVATPAMAGPTVAKSDLEFSASAHHFRVGHSVIARASGGSDDAAGYTQVCVQRLAGRGHTEHWYDLKCSPVTANTSGYASTALTLTSRRPARVQLRAHMLATDAKGRHRVSEQVSQVETVRFTR